MAKLKGIVKIEGLLDGLSFYKTQDGYLVRSKTGASAKTVASHPAFTRTRELNREFQHVTATAKLLHTSLKTFAKAPGDAKVFSRLTFLMTQLKDLDQIHAPGERTILTGMETPKAKELFLQFDYNPRAPLRLLMRKKVLADIYGSIVLPALSPSDIQFPPGATNVSIRGAFATIDFSTGTKALEETNSVQLNRETPAEDIVLQTLHVLTQPGIRFAFLKLAFTQTVNGQEYPLENGVYNAVGIVEVGSVCE